MIDWETSICRSGRDLHHAAARRLVAGSLRGGIARLHIAFDMIEQVAGLFFIAMVVTRLVSLNWRKHL